MTLPSMKILHSSVNLVIQDGKTHRKISCNEVPPHEMLLRARRRQVKEQLNRKELMSHNLYVSQCSRARSSFGRRHLAKIFGFATAMAVFTVLGFPSTQASNIFGTLSNFDIYNTTPE